MNKNCRLVTRVPTPGLALPDLLKDDERANHAGNAVQEQKNAITDHCNVLPIVLHRLGLVLESQFLSDEVNCFNRRFQLARQGFGLKSEDLKLLVSMIVTFV